MRFEGIHHVTCITGDAPRNVDFYTRALGLRLVKKTVNQDDPSVYHLFYADQAGRPGADITFFEYPARGGTSRRRDRPPSSYRVGSEEALDFWEARLGGDGIAPAQRGPLLFAIRGARARAAPRRDDRRAARRRAPRDPGRARAAAASTASAPSPPPRRSRELLERGSASSPPASAAWEARGACAAAPMPTTRRRSGAGIPEPAPCTTSHGRRRWRARRVAALAGARRRGTRRR